VVSVIIVYIIRIYNIYIGLIITDTFHVLFFFNHTPPTEIYTLSLHDALPIYERRRNGQVRQDLRERGGPRVIKLGVHQVATADRQVVVDLDDPAPVRRDGGLAGLEVGVREVGAGGDPELPEKVRRRARGRRQNRGRHRGFGEVEVLVQLDAAPHDVESATQRKPWRDLISHGGLDVHRADDVLVACE